VLFHWELDNESHATAEEKALYEAWLQEPFKPSGA
jgi:hypothetical protein